MMEIKAAFVNFRPGEHCTTLVHMGRYCCFTGRVTECVRQFAIIRNDNNLFFSIIEIIYSIKHLD